MQYLSGGVLAREYGYNAQGQRVVKRIAGDPANDLYFVYDEAGHLLGDYKADGSRVREYVWIDDTPIAMLNASGTVYFYLFTDHLNTPRAAVRASTNQIVWRWDAAGSAFGDHDADLDADGDGTTFCLPLRYPGQYFDGETDTHYSYFRDYEPGAGRYLQSDPIGLGGGVSTFAYAISRPLLFSDPLGLTVANPAWYTGVPAINWAMVRAAALRSGVVGTAGTIAATAGWHIGEGINSGYELLPNSGSIGTDLHRGVEQVSAASALFADSVIRACEADDEEKQRACEAARDSVLNTCASLTGDLKRRCLAAARETYRSCMEQESR